MTDQDAARMYRVDPSRTAFRAVGDEGVVLDLSRSVYFGLNRSANVLWPVLLAGATRADLVAALIDGEPAPLDERQAADEIAAFLAALEAEGLLTPATHA